MEKSKADSIITSYLKKIYHFSLSKTKSIDLAEELASRITFEVYKSLLQVENVHNINKYVYRIANNVYAQFVREEVTNKQILNETMQDITDTDSSKDKIYEEIRNEILYLSNLQKDIVVMYYYEKLKTKAIATRLNISQAKVKWHLIDARNHLKKGLLEKKVNLQQITFTEMRNIGKLGFLQKFIDMSFYFNKKHIQNIAFCTYHTPKTSIEIAKELNIPVAYVEDELNHLVKNGFMNSLSSKKYQTNVYIVNFNNDYEEKLHDLLSKHAKIVYEKYISLLLNSYKEILSKTYTPINDMNFLLWSVINYSCVTKLIIPDTSGDISDFMIKRRDGGENIAHVIVKHDFKAQKSLYKNNIDLWVTSNSKTTYPITAWQFFSQFDERVGDFADWTQKIFFTLYDFISGRLNNDLSNIDKYISLFDKGFIANRSGTDIVNMVVTDYPETNFKQILPNIPNDLVEIGKELNEEMFLLQKDYFPEHMQELCRKMNQNTYRKGEFRVFLIKYLLKKGILKPVKRIQRKTVNMILFKEDTCS